MTLRVLITGASGFIGQAISARATRQGFAVRAALRKQGESSDTIESVVVGEIDGSTDWGAALRGVDGVIHLAARVHVMKDTSADPLAEFRKVNVQGTENLARQAARAGVKRIVYVSSIKVNGEETPDQRSYTEQDTPAPVDPYGVSKCEAEEVLHQVSQETGLEVVIVRPPLVYGPGVKGNFAQMLKVLSKGIPLPLASVRNRRSIVYVGNLADALILCSMHPAAAGQTYLISDGEDIATPELLRSLATAMGVRVRLFSFPPSVLRSVAKLLGKSAQIERLTGSLRVDSGKIRRNLNWVQPYSLQQGLQATAKWYRIDHI